MVKTSNKRRGDELEKHGPPPRMLLSKMLSKDLMRSAVLGFLDRLSVARFMVVEEFSRVFHLRSCFCEGHGTILGQIHTDMPASLIKQCADCEMPKIGKFRCGKCDDFSKRTHFGSCSDCEKSECNGCMFFCVKCSREFCFECKDSIHCGQCKIPFCRECRDTLHCERCEESFCLECSEVVVCVKCDKTVCNDCEWIPYCAKCNKDVCRKCREIECCEVSETGYYCEGCNKMFSCIGCKDCFHCQRGFFHL
jgi:hypothetical protein